MLAFAREAARCVATWRATVPGAAIDEEIVTSATGPSREAAERAARRRIGRVAELTADDLVSIDDYLHPAQFAACTDAASREAEISCNRVRATADGDLCFVTFDDPECWDGRVLTVDDSWSRALVTGRQRMCEEVDARQVRLNYTDLDRRRAECRESCATRTVVSCPPER
ncbi:MAG: hypothetical protein ACK4YP_27150, partial [Myxococcota bacterium]